MKRLLLALPFLSLLVLGSPAAADSTPTDVIARFQEKLVELMKEARFLGIKERYEWLEPSVDEAFSLPIMAQMTVGEHWSKAPPDQQQRFVDSFKRYNLSYLATLFSEYGDQTFRVVGEAPGPQDTVVVSTVLEDPDGTHIEMAYFMRQVNGSWKALDVIVDNGISEVRTRQSEFARFLNDGGLPALSDTLRRKADELLNEGGAGG